MERQRATARAGDHPRNAGELFRDEIGKTFVEQLTTPVLWRDSHHRGLLLALAAAAHPRGRGSAEEPFENLFDLGHDQRGEVGTGGGVVEVREHQVLPYEQA